MVPQLADPLLLLILQLLLHLPQHFVNVLHDRPALFLHTHFHMPPAILAIQMPPTPQASLYSQPENVAPFQEWAP
jgi:hypothetical protein